MSHFIPCSNDLDGPQFPNLFIKEIVRLDELAHDIISHKGTLLTSDLGKETRRKIEVEGRLTTAFEPQTEGQTERTKAILE